MKRRRSREVSGELQDWIKDRVILDGWTAAQISGHFKQMDEWKQKTFLMDHKAASFPEIHTIRRMVKDLRIRDKSGSWSVTDSSPEDARLILDVFADTIGSGGGEGIFTQEQAAWVLKVRKMAPTMMPDRVWRLARYYMFAESKGQSTEALDTYLAFRPWESANRFMNYNYLVRLGAVKEVPGRFGIDGIPQKLEKMGSLEGWFEKVSRQGSPLDDPPLTFRQKLWGIWAEQAQDDVNVLEGIRKRNPWLYHSLVELWDDSRQEAERFTEQFAQKHRGEFEEALAGLTVPVQDVPMQDEPRWDGYTDAQTKLFSEFGKHVRLGILPTYNAMIDFFKSHDDVVLNITPEEFNRLVSGTREDVNRLRSMTLEEFNHVVKEHERMRLGEMTREEFHRMLNSPEEGHNKRRPVKKKRKSKGTTKERRTVSHERKPLLSTQGQERQSHSQRLPHPDLQRKRPGR